VLFGLGGKQDVARIKKQDIVTVIWQATERATDKGVERWAEVGFELNGREQGSRFRIGPSPPDACWHIAASLPKSGKLKLLSVTSASSPPSSQQKGAAAPLSEVFVRATAESGLTASTLVGAGGRDLRSASLKALSGWDMARIEPEVLPFLFERRRWQSGRVMLRSVQTGKPVAPRFDVMTHRRVMPDASKEALKALRTSTEGKERAVAPTPGQSITFKFGNGESDWSDKPSGMSTLSYSAGQTYTLAEVKESNGKWWITVTQWATLWAPFSATQEFEVANLPVCSACHERMREEEVSSVGFCDTCLVSLDSTCPLHIPSIHQCKQLIEANVTLTCRWRSCLDVQMLAGSHLL
jgi:hypothetical protein